MSKFRVCLSFGNRLTEMYLSFDYLTKAEADMLIALSQHFEGEGVLSLEGWSTQPMESVEAEREAEKEEEDEGTV